MKNIYSKMIIEHGNTLISSEIFENEFVCNLDKCKGACCIEGNRGAPIERHEIDKIKTDIEAILPYMESRQKALLDKEGFYEGEDDDDLATTCLPTGECVFVYKENGILGCAIEKAYNEGKTDFKKPISCHLYPIRLGKIGDMESINYHRWSICKDACTLGKKLNVPVYQFLEAPLIRKYGKDWYQELNQIYLAWQQEK